MLRQQTCHSEYHSNNRRQSQDDNKRPRGWNIWMRLRKVTHVFQGSIKIYDYCSSQCHFSDRTISQMTPGDDMFNWWLGKTSKLGQSTMLRRPLLQENLEKISVLIIWWTENTEINFTWLWRSWIVYQIDSQKKRENIK